MTEQIPPHDARTAPPDDSEIEASEARRVTIELFGLPDEEFEEYLEDFLASRIAELSRNSSGEAINIESGRVEEFIGPDQAMQLSPLMKPYYMDDFRAYASSLGWSRYQYNMLKEQRSEISQDRLLFNAALKGTQIGQTEYFGSYVGDARKRISVSGDFIDDEQVNVSIADFGSAAMCMERAAVVHNAMKIMGLDSRFTLGHIHETSADTQIIKDEPHAWVVVRNPATGKHYSYDPTNPILHVDTAGLYTWADPSLKTIDDTWSQGMDVLLKEVRINPDGTPVDSNIYEIRYTFSTDPLS